MVKENIIPISLSFSFTQDEWQIILESLATQPFNKVTNIISSLQRQASEALAPKPVEPQP